MPTHAVLDERDAPHVAAETLEQAILRHIDEQAVIGLDTLVILLSEYSWSQIFHVVDRLARSGQMTLRRYRSEYTLFSTHYAA